jgi:hypothetical protein
MLRLPILLLSLLWFATVCGNAAAPASTTPVSTTNPAAMQIVTCREDANRDAVIAEFHLTPRFVYRAINGFAARMDEATIQKLKADGRVLLVEADGPVALCDQTNTTGLVRMGIDRFPVAHIDGTPKPLDVGVAVIDSGIGPHPDLNVYTTYCSFCIDEQDGADEVGHGTSVAGVVAATDNGFGIVGVAPGVRLWNIKAFAPPPNNSWSFVVDGMDYVLQHSNEISVVNISLINEGSSPFSTVQFYVRQLVSAGIVVVTGAGNNGRDLAGLDGIYGTTDDAFPAAFSESMAVSAMDPATDTLWPLSNFSQVARTNNYVPNATNYVHSPGGAIDVVAPGVNILTTVANGGYGVFTGTSLAAPNVAGLVALYIAANGRATNAAGVYRIRQAIVDASLAQSQWRTNNTHDPDTNPEPLAIASESWVPKPAITNTVGAPGNFQVQFATVPGYDYTVQSASVLIPPIPWTNLVTVSGSSNAAPASVTDTNATSRSFYRLSRTPSP